MIYLNGMEQEDHTSVMFFGDLFRYSEIGSGVREPSNESSIYVQIVHQNLGQGRGYPTESSQVRIGLL